MHNARSKNFRFAHSGSLFSQGGSQLVERNSKFTIQEIGVAYNVRALTIALEKSYVWVQLFIHKQHTASDIMFQCLHSSQCMVGQFWDVFLPLSRLLHGCQVLCTLCSCARSQSGHVNTSALRLEGGFSGSEFLLGKQHMHACLFVFEHCFSLVGSALKLTHSLPAGCGNQLMLGTSA